MNHKLLNLINESITKTDYLSNGIIADLLKLAEESNIWEILENDKTGKICYLIAKHRHILSIKPDLKTLEDFVIQKDKMGFYCYLFAKDIPGADISRLENAVIEKDGTGEICLLFAKNIKSANVEKLTEAIIQKDRIGIYCYLLAKHVPNVDVLKIIDALIEKKFLAINPEIAKKLLLKKLMSDRKKL